MQRQCAAPPGSQTSKDRPRRHERKAFDGSFKASRTEAPFSPRAGLARIARDAKDCHKRRASRTEAPFPPRTAQRAAAAPAPCSGRPHCARSVRNNKDTACHRRVQQQRHGISTGLVTSPSSSCTQCAPNPPAREGVCPSCPQNAQPGTDPSRTGHPEPPSHASPPLTRELPSLSFSVRDSHPPRRVPRRHAPNALRVVPVSPSKRAFHLPSTAAAAGRSAGSRARHANTVRLSTCKPKSVVSRQLVVHWIARKACPHRPLEHLQL